MNRFIIDCNTKGKLEGINRLAKLKSTIDIQDGGVYRECPAYSQIWIETSLSETELEQWLWKTKFRKFHYIGVAVND